MLEHFCRQQPFSLSAYHSQPFTELVLYSLYSKIFLQLSIQVVFNTLVMAAGNDSVIDHVIVTASLMSVMDAKCLGLKSTPISEVSI